MLKQVPSRHVLDEMKKQTVIGLLTNGSSRRVAARFIGCAPSTITRTAARDSEFAERLVRAEQTAEVSLLKSVQAAAKLEKHWRAAAWLLERRNPQDFASRPPRLFAGEEVAEILGQFVGVLRADLPEENCRKALEKLDAMLTEFRTAEAPIVVGEGAEEEGERG